MCIIFFGVDNMKNDEYYMQIAYKEALKAYKKGEIPVGAIIVSNINGKITPSSIYAYIDQALGEWDQRPIFKTNVKEFNNIETLANGESAILEYSIVASETEDASAQTNGIITVKAD